MLLGISSFCSSAAMAETHESYSTGFYSPETPFKGVTAHPTVAGAVVRALPKKSVKKGVAPLFDPESPIQLSQLDALVDVIEGWRPEFVFFHREFGIGAWGGKQLFFARPHEHAVTKQTLALCSIQYENDTIQRRIVFSDKTIEIASTQVGENREWSHTVTINAKYAFFIPTQAQINRLALLCLNKRVDFLEQWLSVEIRSVIKAYCSVDTKEAHQMLPRLPDKDFGGTECSKASI